MEFGSNELGIAFGIIAGLASAVIWRWAGGSRGTPRDVSVIGLVALALALILNVAGLDWTASGVIAFVVGATALLAWRRLRRSGAAGDQRI